MNYNMYYDMHHDVNNYCPSDHDMYHSYLGNAPRAPVPPARRGTYAWVMAHMSNGVHGVPQGSPACHRCGVAGCSGLQCSTSYFPQYYPQYYDYYDYNMKRAAENDDHGAAKKGFWAAGLLSAMKNPECIIKEDDRVVVIVDKYPKAEHHFLVLPKEDISSINKLTTEHISLLRHMENVGHEISKMYPNHSFRFGYHAHASMLRLHLHVISKDFVSIALKTKKHWNSFTTPFFILSHELIESIEKNGKIKVISNAEAKELLDRPLKCHKCDMKPSNMPKLKQHLMVHHLKEKHESKKQ